MQKYKHKKTHARTKKATGASDVTRIYDDL